MFRHMRWLAVVCLLVVWAMIPAGWAGAAPSGKLEIFSWWTAGGEAEGLAGMFSAYKKLYPNVEIVNATVAGGAGTNAKAVLATRLWSCSWARSRRASISTSSYPRCLTCRRGTRDSSSRATRWEPAGPSGGWPSGMVWPIASSGWGC